LWLSVLKGGPFDGLPALSLRFEHEEDALDFGAVLALLLAMTPPPMHFQIVHAAGGLEDAEQIVRLLQFIHGKGMASSVEIYGGFEPWMSQTGRRIFHTEDTCVPHPVEEIVFHTQEPPTPTLFPFHIISRPVMWWAGGADERALRLCPQGMRLYIPKRVPEMRLFPKDDA
jgi:hypothetical protein